MSRAQNDLSKFTGKIADLMRDAAKQDVLRPVALKAIELIQRRTRLGYGVPDGTNGTAEREKLKPLSERYIEARKKGQLGDFATPKRSNLTFTGQLLASLDVIKLTRGSVVIGPTGSRRGGGTNAQVAKYVAEQGRQFLSLSRPEAEQLRRFYRNAFGDLLKNKRLS